ncbi:MAG: peptidase M15, partial [Chitinophagaceae bacterium]
MIYKIPHQSYTLSLLMAIFFHFSISYSQQTVISKYGTPVLNSISVYRATVKKEPFKKMVELNQTIPGIVYDLRYAG